MNKNKPTLISSETVYQGRVFNIIKTQIKEADKQYEREIITHEGSAVIVPMLDDDNIILVKQYRHATGKFLLELPAGSVEAGETPLECAIREVEEETGFKARNFQKLTEFYVSPGFLTEKMYVYRATELEETRQNLDEDENVSIEIISFEKAFEMLRNNEIEDAKTMLGLIFAGQLGGFQL